jgi:hypothetical protein
VIISSIPTRRECEEMAFELDFSDMVCAAMVEIALKTNNSPWMQAVGEA